MQRSALLMLLTLLPISVFGQQSIDCQVARQQILAAVNAQAQARAQAQANAQNQAQIEGNRSAQMSPDAWGRSMVYQGASQFGNAIGGALGAEDALQAQERRIQEAIQQYKSVCER